MGQNTGWENIQNKKIYKMGEYKMGKSYREGEKGPGAVQAEIGSARMVARVFARVAPRVNVQS